MAGPSDSPVYRLPLTREARDRFLPDGDYEDTGDWPVGFVRVAETAQLHGLAARLREADTVASGGALAAFAATSEAMARLVSRYVSETAPGALRGLEAQLGHALGADAEGLLAELGAAFSVPAVGAREARPEGAMRTEREPVLAALLVIGAARHNVALTPLRVLFEPEGLDLDRLDHAVAVAATFFETRPRVGPEKQTLFEALLAPGRAAPTLGEQLDFVRERWGELLPEGVLEHVLRAHDELVEEHKEPTAGGAGAIELPTVTRRGLSEAYRALPERAWMPETVLVAKNAKVWLHQLSERYGAPIARLDEVPDEALASLAGRGFTALWLIGVWERSPASRRIKQRRGQLEAEASAYALFDYHIATDLGGDDALDRLGEQAARVGLRLAADMVPNHTGLYSRWMIDHPEWFLGGEQPPYPGYTFAGPDLAEDPVMEVRIEDGYWDHRDAAVVFERRDRATGERRYVYHGNDGTQMPWNDTAQLDFTNPEVRRAVLETILGVAERFPVLRFDAAMTLTRYHYQRLWFPAPGSAGAVPSRARFGMSVAELEERMPREFWREVVEAAAERVPEALFIAEAFWLTETLFVRELGMHRVYNSAFMRMLSAEKNAEYRAYLKEIVANDPAMLGRFVNFMTNPDEEPAATLFGKGEKYLGVATLLIALPGLPMFGHGQVEGLSEKYGMEFRRPQRAERVDAPLVRRHYEELVPLLRRRGLFAGTEGFRLFDLVGDDGAVVEDVFAFVNGDAATRVLVVFNNCVEAAEGWLRTSAPQQVAELAEPVSVSLAEAVGVGAGATGAVILRELRFGLDWVVPAEQLVEDGLRLALRGYQTGVWMVVR